MLEEHIPLSNPENYPIYVLNEFPGESICKKYRLLYEDLYDIIYAALKNGGAIPLLSYYHYLLYIYLYTKHHLFQVPVAPMF